MLCHSDNARWLESNPSLREDFYVWSEKDEWEQQHDQAVVEEVFRDECKGRGYAHKAIFAGVATGRKDINGEMIYTGDVLNLRDSQGIRHTWALSTFDFSPSSDYIFLLDNHCLSLSECRERGLRLERAGTVFFRLDRDEYPVQTVRERALKFNNSRGGQQEDEKLRLMARYTPNFDKEYWKYAGLETLGITFNWR